MSDLRRYISVTIWGIVILGLCMLAVSPGYAARDGRPFWTEKSAFIEGDDLYVVGVASNSKTVEDGRKQAFENGKLELMNFAQVTSLEARGLVIETQMTFEEPQSNGTVTVYRLLRVPTDKLRTIQDNLRTQTVVQEQALEKAQRDLQAVQQSLARKQQLLDGQNRQVQETLDSVSKLQETLGQKTARIEQTQREVEQLLQRLSDKVKQTEHTQSPPRVADNIATKPIANTVPLYQRLQETEAKLDAQEAQLRNLAKRAKERLASENETAKSYQRKCKYIAKGMTSNEVEEVLGKPSKVMWNDFQKWHDYQFMDSKGETGEISVYFAFNALVKSMGGCEAKSF